MKVLTRLLILVALTLLVPVLGQAAPATVKFMSSDADLPAAFVDKFNKENPDKITIVRTEPDYAKFMAEAASGNASDLINVGEGSDLAYYVPRGLFKDITSYINKSKVLKLDGHRSAGQRRTTATTARSSARDRGTACPRTTTTSAPSPTTRRCSRLPGIPILERDGSHHLRRAVRLAKKLTKKDGSAR